MTRDELLEAIDEEIDRKVETYDCTHNRDHSHVLAGAIVALQWVHDLVEEEQ